MFKLASELLCKEILNSELLQARFSWFCVAFFYSLISENFEISWFESGSKVETYISSDHMSHFLVDRPASRHF